MYGRVCEPERNNYSLCLEPTLTMGRGLLTQLKSLLGAVAAAKTKPRPRVEEFCEMLEKEIECVEREFESDLENFKDRKTASELRTINEDQLQEAVKFLTAVWQGEITDATMEQIAAARCFMRAE
jgi:hypothetical protein